MFRILLVLFQGFSWVKDLLLWLGGWAALMYADHYRYDAVICESEWRVLRHLDSTEPCVRLSRGLLVLWHGTSSRGEAIHQSFDL